MLSGYVKLVEYKFMTIWLDFKLEKRSFEISFEFSSRQH